MPPKWPNPPVDQRIKELWHDYYGTKEIAQIINAEFGLNLTRNAVIGRKFRMGLEKHWRYTRKEPKPTLPDPGPMPPVYTGPVPLTELTNRHCRWPTALDDLNSAATSFCGRPEADLSRGKPYCPLHTQRARG